MKRPERSSSGKGKYNTFTKKPIEWKKYINITTPWPKIS